MKLNVESIINDLSGIPFKHGMLSQQDKKDDRPDMKLSHVIMDALLATEKGENLTGQKKMDYWKTAEKVNEGGSVELSADEIKNIKDRIGFIFTQSIVGPCWTILESLKSDE